LPEAPPRLGQFYFMAQGKKKVLVYTDWILKFEALTDEEAGKLIKHFFRYINDLNPEYPDRITEISFIDIKNTLKRDLVIWESKAENSRENGKKGGRPINPKEPKITQQVNLEPEEPVNVIVKDNVNVSDNVNIEERKLKFASTLEPYKSIYGNELLKDFFAYWTEPNKSQTKFKKELEKTWDLERRLATWVRNEKKFGVNPTEPTSKIERQINQAERILHELTNNI
jgi:hypothetical protein